MRLEGLGQFFRAGNAAGERAGRDFDVDIVFKGEGEEDAGSDPRTRRVTHEPSQFQDRPALVGRPQVSLVGDALLIERQDVRDGGPGIEQRQGQIFRITRRQLL